MNAWIKKLKKNPIPILLDKGDIAIQYWVKKDLIDQEDLNLKNEIYEHNEVKSIIRKQKPSGYWKYPGGGNKHIRSATNYNQYETFRQLSFLVEKYAFTRKDQAVQKAAEFLFKFQSKQGDIRGIYGNQYSPNYSAAIIELLIKAGYENDWRVEKFFKWAIDIRQNDGGWTIPLRTIKGSTLELMNSRQTIEPDRTKPHQHLATGVVLRAFAAHPKYQNVKVAKEAAILLCERFFKSDKYPDRKNPDFWKKIRFPFIYTDILSALDSVSKIGIPKNNPQVKKGLDWLLKKQRANKLWNVGFAHEKSPSLDLWVTLAACRVFKRYYK